jgi:hypothetical protein
MGGVACAGALGRWTMMRWSRAVSALAQRPEAGYNGPRGQGGSPTHAPTDGGFAECAKAWALCCQP